MLRGRNAGVFDHVITFYAPVKAKDSIGDTVATMTAQSGTVKAERVFKSGTERIEGNQQVGLTTQDFRVRKSQHSITQEWEFNVYEISDTSVVERYKVLGIQKEGRANTLKITAELRDNG